MQAKGPFVYSREEAKRLADGLQRELTAEGAQPSREQIACMKPCIDHIIFNELFPSKPPPSGRPPPATEIPKSRPITRARLTPHPSLTSFSSYFRFSASHCFN
jgi:hypothetical protein